MSTKVDLQEIADKLDFDLEDVEMIFGIFLETATESLENINKAINENDMELLFQSAHAIKGSAANLTLTFIADIAKEIEDSARESKNIDYEEKYNSLKNIIDDLKQ